MSVALTDAQLGKLVGITHAREWRPHLNRAMDMARVSNRIEAAAGFLAQVLHESYYLTLLVENLNYSAEGLRATFPTRVSEAQSRSLARKPEAIANHVYAGRLGNIEPGDGWRFRGRGPLQITGRWNYRKAGEFAGVNLEDFPELLELPENGATAAAWFWNSAGIERRVVGFSGEIRTAMVTRCVNGGTNGLDARVALERRVLAVLGESS